MLEKIKQALNEKQIGIYVITQTKEERLELYFIKKKLDMRRQTNTLYYSVTVYRDFEENGKAYRGSSSVDIPYGINKEELEKKLESAYFSASFVKNPWYPLPGGERTENPVDECPELAESWRDMAIQAANAAFKEDCETEAFLNSMEIFAKKKTVRLVNSEGNDVSFTQYGVSGEFVAQCEQPQDVETYESFRYDRFDETALREKVRRTLIRTKDRANAKKAAPAGTYRLLLSEKYVATFFSYFMDRSRVSAVYAGYSNYKIGDDVQEAGGGNTVRGDKISAVLTATIPYSLEGIRMKDRVLLENGILKTYHGSSRISYYLKAEPTGEYRKLTVKHGNTSFEEMKKEPYLHVVNFSDFQMDSMTGNFGGEIRLAYWYDGEKVIPVTGGSVNGSILSAQKCLNLSLETQNEADFSGPFAVCMDSVTVAGE